MAYVSQIKPNIKKRRLEARGHVAVLSATRPQGCGREVFTRGQCNEGMNG